MIEELLAKLNEEVLNLHRKVETYQSALARIADYDPKASLIAREVLKYDNATTLSLGYVTMQERVDTALDLASLGSFDGAHHKMYAIDQIVRALCGVPEIEETARDAHGKEYTYTTQGTNLEYQAWIKNFCEGDEGPNTYEWDEGIAP